MSHKTVDFVIPAEAGIQCGLGVYSLLDPRLRGGDETKGLS